MTRIENIHPTIPSTDLDESQRFYTEALGLELMDRDDYGFLLRNGDWMARVFVSGTSGTAAHTVASFGVNDVARMVQTLRERGVEFEEYDTHEIETVGGVASFGPVDVAWFRDVDGNILAISNGLPSDALDLREAYMHPTIPAADLERAREFYTDVLGLPEPEEDSVGQGLVYTLGKSLFYLYPSQGAGSSDNTAAGFTVSGIERLVGSLKNRGVTFEDYDLPGIKTVDGVATLSDVAKAAWMRDSESNLMALVEILP